MVDKWEKEAYLRPNPPQRRTAMHVAVDIGRSAVKYAVRTDGGVHYGAFLPCFAHGWPDAIPHTAADAAPLIRGRVGDLRFHISPFGEVVEIDVSPRKVSRPTALLLLAAAARAREETGAQPDGPIHVVTGLPVAFAQNDAPVLVQTLRSLLETGVEIFTRDDRPPVRLTIRDIDLDIVAEGDGIYIDHIHRTTDSASATAAVVDIGYTTTHVIHYEAFRRLSFRTIPIGARQVFELLFHHHLAPWGPWDDGLIHTAAEDLARLGRIRLPVRLVYHNPDDETVARALREATETVWNRLHHAILSALPLGGAHTVIVAGGGAALFGVRERWPAVHVPPDPRWAQTRGYLALAEELP
jgi:hypothetical protein